MAVQQVLPSVNESASVILTDSREAEGMDLTTLYAEPSEEETINSMILVRFVFQLAEENKTDNRQGIIQIPQPEPANNIWPYEQNWKQMRNFASYIVHEESIRASLKHDGKEVPQELLCISTY